MKRTIAAFCMAILVFAGSSMTALAAVCPHPNAPGGVHHFTSCKPAGNGGRIEDHGFHSYLYGYDDTGKPMYRNDCRMTEAFQYCIYVCHWCGLENPDSPHEHSLGIQHSISHK